MIPFTCEIKSEKRGEPEGVLPYKGDGVARWKISRTPLKGTRILLYGRVPNSFPPLRGTNSCNNNKLNITGTANFNSNKDNFRTLSSQGHFESIVINPLKDTTSTPVTFIEKYPPALPRPGRRDGCIRRLTMQTVMRDTEGQPKVAQRRNQTA